MMRWRCKAHGFWCDERCVWVRDEGLSFVRRGGVEIGGRMTSLKVSLLSGQMVNVSANLCKRV